MTSNLKTTNAWEEIEAALIYRRLYARYGELGWWPARTPYEVMVGAVLTQNTAWGNVERALANFEGRLSPEWIAGMGQEELIELIRPAGFFNQKCQYLKTLTAWFGRYGYSADTVGRREWRMIRDELMALRGIGDETADCLLLYAFGFPVFMADAYTVRLLMRLSGAKQPISYAAARDFFAAALKPEQYANAHGLIVENGKAHCRKRPRCEGCPLMEQCEHYKNPIRE